MFTKEERLFIWKKVYEMIDRLEDGEIHMCCVKKCSVYVFQNT